ncbi:competence/damage-inducible protein A [Williamsia sp. CHRR-6]|uniref:competence/damage-inducible protein A n=1 Tax=Williamsia sp. CHRR-6 TaxID=2835871 RepID=UPI001BDAF97A|nr:competence/damage-inducible protein A [Williamsia sp. CHRR-6]MBT0565750.1 competence/damage-inducible protein A [Williamsia sp. CHRR-6]
MTVRAGIVVTGTEVLSGRVADKNGPYLAEALLGLGVELAHITICGDRPADLLAQMRFLADDGVDLIITTGGLGPTADDLTVQMVAEFTGRPLLLDAELEVHITAIVDRWLAARGQTSTPDSVRAATRKQAMVPQGARWVPPTGTAPGVVVPGTPAVVVLPGPPRELQAMWPAAITTPELSQLLSGANDFEQATIRAFGLAESELAESLRIAEQTIPGYADLEVTTCLRRSEVEMVTRFTPTTADTYAAVLELLLARHAAQIFSTDGTTIDQQIADLLQGRTIATAESCTGGMIAARLTDLAGSSAYVLGGVVSYADEAKTEVLGVDATLIAEHGAVSEPVAAAMARGALARLGADTAVSTSGIAGPGGGSAEKPVGTVCFGIALAGRPVVTHTLRLPGDRADVRERATSIALHLLRRELQR